jgi:hypothetical protein
MEVLTQADAPPEGQAITLHPQQDAFAFGDWSRGGFFGEFGNGKTLSAAIRARFLSEKFPRNVGIVLRKTWGDNRDTTLKQFHEIFPDLEQYYKASEHAHFLSNGSVIFWRGMDRIGRVSQLTNYNLGWFWMEQAEEMLKDIFQMLEGRLKLRRVPTCGWVTANPAGHNWCWNLFIAPNKDPRYKYFQPPPRWNRSNLPTNYYEDKESTWPKAMIDRYLNGLHEGYEGLVYDCFAEKPPYVIAPLKLKAEDIQVIDEGQDYGISDVNPTVWLWGAKTRDNHIHIFDEFYKFNCLPTVSGPAVKAKRELLLKPVRSTYGCPRTFQHEKDGRTPADMFWKDYGIRILQNPMRFEVRMPITYKLMKLGQLHIWNNCTNLISEMHQFAWATMDDVPNHAIEALERMIPKLSGHKGDEKPKPPEKPKEDEHIKWHKEQWERMKSGANADDIRSLV